MTIQERLAARHARRDSRAREADRLRRGHPSEPKMGYRCEFHRPKSYRYRVARVDQYGPLPWFRLPGWNAYRSPHGTARIGATVVVGDWSYCVKWGRSRAFGAPVRALREDGPA